MVMASSAPPGNCKAAFVDVIGQRDIKKGSDSEGDDMTTTSPLDSGSERPTLVYGLRWTLFNKYGRALAVSVPSFVLRKTTTVTSGSRTGGQAELLLRCQWLGNTEVVESATWQTRVLLDYSGRHKSRVKTLTKYARRHLRARTLRVITELGNYSRSQPLNVQRLAHLLATALSSRSRGQAHYLARFHVTAA